MNGRVAPSGGTPDREERLGLARDLRLLALLHDREPTADLLAMLRRTPVGDLFELRPTSERGIEALDFFDKALAIAVAGGSARLDELAADHAAIYLTYAHRAAPTESPWIDPEGLMAQQPMFAVRDWYGHWGLEVPDWRRRNDDHLVVQLGFLAHLMEAVDHPAAPIDAARFLDRHLLRWFDAFAERVKARCWTAYWAAVAALTSAWLQAFRLRLSAIPGCETTEIEPIEAERERLRAEATRNDVNCTTPSHVPGLAPSW